jgi:hypothetical protein
VRDVGKRDQADILVKSEQAKVVSFETWRNVVFGLSAKSAHFTIGPFQKLTCRAPDGQRSGKNGELVERRAIFENRSIRLAYSKNGRSLEIITEKGA